MTHQPIDRLARLLEAPLTRRGGVLLLGAGLATVVAVPVAEAKVAMDAEETQFLRLLNRYRRQRNRPVLKLNRNLTIAAERHSQYQAQRGGSWTHVGPKGYRTVEDRLEKANYIGWTMYAENVLYDDGSGSAERAFDAWKKSRAHNTNMLSLAAEEIGIARVKSKKGRWYWTTDFGARG
jgi:uncharacterized protein YkwD